MTPLFAISWPGLIVFFFVVAVIAVAIAAWRSPEFLRNLKILFGKGNAQLSTAADREEQILKEQTDKVTECSHQVSDIKGTLVTAREDLATADRDVQAAKDNVKLAKEMAAPALTKKIQEANPGITADALKTKLAEAYRSDTQVLNQAKKLELALKARDAQAESVQEMEAALTSTKAALEKAQGELENLRITAKSDRVREKAGQVYGTAASTMEALNGLNNAGGAFQKEHDKAREEHNQKKSRFEDSLGSEQDQAFEQAKKARSLGSLIDDN